MSALVARRFPMIPKACLFRALTAACTLAAAIILVAAPYTQAQDPSHKLTAMEMMDSRMLERPIPSLLDEKLFNELGLTLNGTDLLLPLLRVRDFNGPGPLD